MLQPNNGYLGLETLICLLLPKSRNTPLGGTLINILVTWHAVVLGNRKNTFQSIRNQGGNLEFPFPLKSNNTYFWKHWRTIYGKWERQAPFPYLHLQYITYWPQIQERRLQYRHSMFTLSYIYSRYV